MLGDNPTNIQVTTRIYVPQIETTTDETICESGIATISATSTDADILWFDSQIGGNQVGIGNNFTTPFLTSTTTYYASVSLNGCATSLRTVVTVTVNSRPSITSTTDDLICSGVATLSATASEGQVFWYDSLTSITPIFIGNTFQTPILLESKTYYVVANRDNCETASRTPVNAIVDDVVSMFDLVQNEYVLCNDIGSVVLETTNPQGNYKYVWKKEGTILTGDLSSITINYSGTYTVSAISEAGCKSLEQTMTVTDSEIATITKDDVIIIDDTANNSIQVANQNLGIGN